MTTNDAQPVLEILAHRLVGVDLYPIRDEQLVAKNLLVDMGIVTIHKHAQKTDLNST